MVDGTSAHHDHKKPIAVIGYSNIACRTATALLASDRPVLFVIESGDRTRAALMAPDAELLAVPILHPETLPGILADCTAAVIAGDDEQFNLHAALLLGNRRPSLALVIRLFNLELGREIEERMPQATVLSVSDRAAPCFAAAAFEDDIGEAWQEDGCLMARRPDGKAAPVAAEGKRRQFFARACRSRLPGMARDLRLDPLLAAVVAAIFAVIGAGTLFFCRRHGMAPGDALYFVVTTLTTTGYGDFSLRELPFSAKVAGMSLMLAGATLFAILFALVTDKLFRMRLDLALGRRPVRRQGHVVVCGAGDVGVRVAECLLLTGAETVVIERDRDGRFNQRIRELGLPLLIDDAALAETLERADVSRAHAIICATDSDMRNLEIALGARSLNPALRTVVRVFDRDFADQMQNTFRVDAALSSSAIAARSFADAALGRAGRRHD